MKEKLQRLVVAKLPFSTRYNHHSSPGLTCPEPSLTKQTFMEECDINNIMKRFENTGILPDLIKENPQYGDFSDPMDYQSALNTVLLAQEQFDALSSIVRERFNNDPQTFLEFTSNPDNSEELVKMGLATYPVPEPTPEPQKVFIVNPDANKA